MRNMQIEEGPVRVPEAKDLEPRPPGHVQACSPWDFPCFQLLCEQHSLSWSRLLHCLAPHSIARGRRQFPYSNFLTHYTQNLTINF